MTMSEFISMAIVLALVAATVVAWCIGHASTAWKAKAFPRAVAFVLAAVMTVGVAGASGFAGALAASRNNDAVVDNYSGGTVPQATPATQDDGSGDPAPDASGKDDDVYMDAIHLTGEQKDAFVSRFSRDFIRRSLANETDKNARLKAVRAYCGVTEGFEDAVNHPVKSWFADVDELRNISSMSDTERDELCDRFFEALWQEIIGNTPYSLMFWDGMTRIDYIHGNAENQKLIDSVWGTVQSMYAGAYKPIENLGVENDLNSIPAMGSPYVGLDYFVQNKTVGVNSNMVVREEWAKTVAYIAAAYGGYRVLGIESRKSVENWCMLDYLEDSKVIPVFCTDEDNLEAIILGAYNKSGKLVSLIGINLADSRLEIFPISTPTPTPTPTQNTPTPVQDEPEPELPPDDTPTKKPTEYTLNVYFRLKDGTKLFETVTEKHKAGDGVNVVIPEDREHYEVDTSSDVAPLKITSQNGKKFVTGKMPARNLDVVVLYDPYVRVFYKEWPSGAACSLRVPTCKDYKNLHEYGEMLNIPTPSYLPGWEPDTWLIREKCPATYTEFVVWFYPPAAVDVPDEPEIPDLPDGQGGKNPANSSQNNNHAQTGSGESDRDPENNEYRPNEPAQPDYTPPESTTSSVPLPAGGTHESTGQNNGGKDHIIVDPNGGSVDGASSETNTITVTNPITSGGVSIEDEPAGDDGWESGGDF